MNNARVFRFASVGLESIGYCIPEEVVQSKVLDGRLEGILHYSLPEGGISALTGVSERRLWPKGIAPSTISLPAARAALELARLRPVDLGAIVYASVWRDFLEPATASVLHGLLGLPASCVAFDISNACHGFLTALVQVANMIERRQIEAGLVVCTEGARGVLEGTLEYLRANAAARKDAGLYASALTIGSASVATVVRGRSSARSDNQFLGGVALVDHSAVDHCVIAEDRAGADKVVLRSNSPRLVRAGLRMGRRLRAAFEMEFGWTLDTVDRILCHQVSRRALEAFYSAVCLDLEKDVSTVDLHGNTASAAVPLGLALAAESGRLCAGDRIAVFGAGAGLSAMLAGLSWDSMPVARCALNGTSPSLELVRAPRGSP